MAAIIAQRLLSSSTYVDYDAVFKGENLRHLNANSAIVTIIDLTVRNFGPITYGEIATITKDLKWLLTMELSEKYQALIVELLTLINAYMRLPTPLREAFEAAVKTLTEEH